MWELKGFAKRMRLRLSRQQPSNTVGGRKKLPPAMEAFLKQMRAQLDKGGYDSATKNRAALVELIIPQVLIIEGDRFRMGDTKDWAIACGQMVGLLAGLDLQEQVLEPAVQEIAELAKKYARDVHNSTRGSVIGTSNTTTNPSAQTQQTAMLADIEKQAELETDPAARAALRAMAENMRKELRDGKKGEKAA